MCTFEIKLNICKFVSIELEMGLGFVYGMKQVSLIHQVYNRCERISIFNKNTFYIQISKL